MTLIRRVYREVHIAIDKLCKNKKFVKEMSCYLKPGYYRSNVVGDSYIKVNSSKFLRLQTFSSYKEMSWLSIVIIRILDFICVVRIKNNGSALFNGTQLLFSSKKLENKIFNFDDEKVLTKYSSRQRMDIIVNNKNKFIDTFLVPKTIEINEKDNYLIEALIYNVKIEAEKAFSILCESLYRHIKAFQCEDGISEAICYAQLRYFSLCYGDSKMLTCLLELANYRSHTHGDLWLNNCLFDGENLYVTDFEHAGERYFLYDFFMFIFTEWHLNNNTKLIYKYFEGCYDAVLEDLFDALTIVYNPKRKQEYFLYFFVCISFERWRGYHDIEPKIKLFIKQFIPSYYCNNEKNDSYSWS